MLVHQLAQVGQVVYAAEEVRVLDDQCGRRVVQRLLDGLAGGQPTVRHRLDEVNAQAARV